MRTLTSITLRNGLSSIPGEWLENINRKSSTAGKRRSLSIAQYRSAHNISEKITLTKRETEILKDLSDGLSRTEIAVTRQISVNTVKMVVNSVYDKLFANSLPDAIRTAIDRRII